ncbi:thioredoxin H-type [Selaginella moellendorffii]|uniref:thioredoxin H-type n=1 Tax=Selaginella moellendorffii TaxID=88036 RepID=UPI000D1CF32E|nr:thioredoxin H-type [Selaginella moellendorffii]|eukprot:XP_024534986.1 thioredoxin H-type [Selaginella moellendorffii]
MGLDMSKFQSLSDHGNVLVMNSRQEWLAKLDEAKRSGKVIVVDFTATWCGPCKAMAPIFVDLSKQFEQLIFVKVDVDALKDVAQDWSIQAMPTFIFIKDGKLLDKIVGANKSELQRKAAMYATGG